MIDNRTLIISNDEEGGLVFNIYDSHESTKYSEQTVEHSSAIFSGAHKISQFLNKYQKFFKANAHHVK